MLPAGGKPSGREKGETQKQWLTQKPVLLQKIGTHPAGPGGTRGGRGSWAGRKERRTQPNMRVKKKFGQSIHNNDDVGGGRRRGRRVKQRRSSLEDSGPKKLKHPQAAKPQKRPVVRQRSIRETTGHWGQTAKRGKWSGKWPTLYRGVRPEN